MEDLNSALKKLQVTLQKLFKNYNALKKENEELKRKNAQIHNTLLEKEKLIKGAEQKTTTTNIVALYNDDEKRLLQSKIEIYLKDIEKCLNLLNS